MDFRRYSSSDIDAIAALELEAFSVGPYSKYMLKKIFRSSNSFNYVGEENGTIAGCVVALPLDRTSADIESIAVRPSFQHRGLGGKLMDLIEAEMRQRGYKKSILEVRDRNEETIQFYVKHGYSVTAHLPTYYRELYRGSRGAYRMEKDL